MVRYGRGVVEEQEVGEEGQGRAGQGRAGDRGLQ